ncbi:MBL fold metallo-hydrolase [Myxococcota bacterium]|nr:MBL fold metallo-hydrolase [Myxococcota bacterium]MBU1429088.1 MBL fold metallo-hydrolase [Myxococcota bacterium]MBU1900073.1 MBL fold metallo-hydrolase [Myxococcota bacterium]
MSDLYLRQLLLGRDFSPRHPAAQMMNFVYFIGDRARGECFVVDPAWDPTDLLRVAEADGMKITGVIATHGHPDHLGGDLYGFKVAGLVELLALNPCPVHAHAAEIPWIQRFSGLDPARITPHEHGDVIQIGGIEVALIHTPGHTPGSQCLKVADQYLISGDTLFVEGCGRVDLPGGDSDALFRSLNERIAPLSGALILLPGHAYGGERATLAEVRRVNPYLRIKDAARWRRQMGG